MLSLSIQNTNLHNRVDGIIFVYKGTNKSSTKVKQLVAGGTRNCPACVLTSLRDTRLDVTSQNQILTVCENTFSASWLYKLLYKSSRTHWTYENKLVTCELLAFWIECPSSQRWLWLWFVLPVVIIRVPNQHKIWWDQQHCNFLIIKCITINTSSNSFPTVPLKEVNLCLTLF